MKLPSNSHSSDHPQTNRTSHTQLPAGDEIMHISNAEEKRELLAERQNVHFVDFSSIKVVYEKFGMDTAIFDTPDLTPQFILDTGNSLTNQLVTTLLQKELSNQEVQLLKDCYSYLSEQDEPQASDYIYVFGAKTPLRIEKAIELYQQGLAPKIIVSGRGPFYGNKQTTTEAGIYSAIAQAAGVPRSAIIVEDASITIPDNVRRTLNMMDANSMPYSSFILVNSPYTQRRGWCVWKKHTPEAVKLYRTNCAAGVKFDSDNWYQNEDGLKVVLGEFVKLRNTIAFNDA